jgi:hypothetical protein
VHDAQTPLVIEQGVIKKLLDAPERVVYVSR